MRIARINIANFRCLCELAVTFDDVTVLVGANGAGKSSVLHALAWFFDGGPLSEEDVSGFQADTHVEVGVTFTDFDGADREALGSYVVGDEATFWRTWSPQDGEKLTGKGKAFSAFGPVRAVAAARPKRAAYDELRADRPELDLPAARSAAAVDEALDAWEAEHQDQLTEARTDATHLFGFAGRARLARRMDFVLVPAISNPDEEARDGRGTLLRQLLDRALGEQSEMRTRLTALEERVSREIHEIMADEGGAALRELSDSVSEQLAQFVPGGEVMLSAKQPTVRVPDLAVDLRVADAGLDTAVGRQGHGFQRALLIALVQQLADLTSRRPPAPPGGEEEVGNATGPALFLALEEPELYQHPLQARHFSTILASLTRQEGPSVQVAYATHSERFVDPARYHQLRRFRRRPDAEWPQSEVTQATVDSVIERLSEVYRPEQLALRVKMTLRRQVAEAVFARAVVLTEGESDVGLVHGLADRDGGLDALGIAVVQGHGKRQLLIPWAILVELGVPTYVVFDADRDLSTRMRANGKSDTDIAAATAQAERENEIVLKALGATPVPRPETEVMEQFAVFADRIERETESWEGFAEAVQLARDERGDWRAKSDDAYRQAASVVAAEPPAVLTSLVARIRALAA